MFIRQCTEQCQVHAGEHDHTRTAWMGNIKTWTGLSVEESIRTTEDRDKWRKYVLGVLFFSRARSAGTLGPRTTLQRHPLVFADDASHQLTHRSVDESTCRLLFTAQRMQT